MNTTLNANTLRRLADLQEQIEGFQAEQAQLMQGLDIQGASTHLVPAQPRTVYTPAPLAPARRPGRPPTKTGRTMSEEARAKIAAGQRRRWAKTHREAAKASQRIAEQIPPAPVAAPVATAPVAAEPVAQAASAAA